MAGSATTGTIAFLDWVFDCCGAGHLVRPSEAATGLLATALVLGGHVLSNIITAKLNARRGALVPPGAASVTIVPKPGDTP
jgi:hypothetical protein